MKSRIISGDCWNDWKKNETMARGSLELQKISKHFIRKKQTIQKSIDPEIQYSINPFVLCLVM